VRRWWSSLQRSWSLSWSRDFGNEPIYARFVISALAGAQVAVAIVIFGVLLILLT
jgi:hypothetical protein